MSWTLDRNLFRYLVGLYALSIGLGVACVAYELSASEWASFSGEFDQLVDRHFGASDETLLLVALGLASTALVWHLVTLVGLRNFHRWARWGFWTSMVAMAATMYGVEGFRPSFEGPLSSGISEISGGLFAVILLMSYSSEHGAVWFRGPLETLKDTF